MASFVLLAGGHVVRGLSAETLWPSNPEVLGKAAMAEVGAAAGQGREPDKATLAKLQLLAGERPLSWEPFLVQGAIALRKNDFGRAQRLIIAARDRAPRSPAARYLLADVYLRTGRPLQAMTEMAVLNRLVPAASVQLAPSLAEYARTPGAAPKIRQILASYPELETPLLAKLSWDPKNTDLIMALASTRRTNGPAPDWQRLMLTTLVNNGQYEKAYTLWRKLADVQGLRSGFYDPGFTEASAPAPFNWQLAQGAGGLAERDSGSLQVLYFGRDDAELASQVLLLPPGRYRLAMNVSGDVAQSNGLSWRVTCAGSNREVYRMPLAKPGDISGEFVVPGDCAAQRFTLAAQAPELPDSAEFRISNLRLTSLR